MEAEYAAAYARLYRGHWWWRVREEILTERIRRELSGKGPRPRILDVGCGAGLFFDVLEGFGEVEGIESDPGVVENSGRWKPRITCGELDESYKPGRTFDLILMLDVLEHVPAPERLLRRAAEILSANGSILITVPAFDWLWTSHDDLNHHVRRYSAKQLRAEITQAGLVPCDAGYMFQSLVVPKLVTRMKETFAFRAPSVPEMPPRLLNAAVIRWYRAEYAICGSLPFGGSVMALAKRRV